MINQPFGKRADVRVNGEPSLFLLPQASYAIYHDLRMLGSVKKMLIDDDFYEQKARVLVQTR